MLQCDSISSEFISFWILDPSELGEFVSKKFEALRKRNVLSTIFIFCFFVTMRLLTKRIYLLFSFGSWIQENSVNFCRNYQEKEEIDAIYFFVSSFLFVVKERYIAISDQANLSPFGSWIQMNSVNF